MIKVVLLLAIAIILALILFIPSILVNTARKIYRKENINEYFDICAIGIDQMMGSVLYQQENFTISSYTYYLCNKEHKQACWFLKFIELFFGKGHCKRAFEWETKHDEKELKRITE